MMNGRIRGKLNNPNANVAVGIWNLEEVFNATLNGSWPKRYGATGGTITVVSGYVYHTFTTSGTFTPITETPLNIEYLVVGGGGGGGDRHGAGGGAGGFLANTFTANVGISCVVTVGGGGVGGEYGVLPLTPNGRGGHGSNSSMVFSPSNQTSYSVTFDGSGDYLQGPNNAVALQMGTGDFTAESWVKIGVAPGSFFPIWGDLRWNFGYQSGWYVQVNSNRTITIRQGGAGSWDEVTSSNTISLEVWNHVAISRASGTMRLFINGVLAASKASTWNYTNAETFKVGAVTIDGVLYYLNGLISNLRVVKGNALYTDTFTPPIAPLTAISNTSLLLCQSNTFVDNSNNNFAISSFGNTAVNIDSPFDTLTSFIAYGGGGGGTYDGNPSGTFGSGGGGGGNGLAGIAGTAGQGSSGGTGANLGGGGGGGAGANGGNASGSNGGIGGAGKEWPTGSGQYYAGGGGGGGINNASGGSGGGGKGDWNELNITSGSVNTGGGGGGTRSESASIGRPGGSGIVIIRYQL